MPLKGKGNFEMLQQAFLITILGMGGVFAFLTLLIFCMNLLRQLIQKTSKSNYEKLAIALAIAQNKES